MNSATSYAITYGLSEEVTALFLSKKPGEATRIINALAGNNVATTPQELKKQLDIIQSEVNEGFENLSNGTMEGLRDDAMDIVFTGYGLANRLGAPADLDYNDVVLSNVCKFDTNEEDAIKTRDKYLAIEVVTEMRRSEFEGHVFFVTKSAFDQVGTDGKKYPGGKWLKSHRWVDCQYRGDVLSPTVVKDFSIDSLSLFNRQQLADLLLKAAAGQYKATSGTLTTELDPDDPTPEHTLSLFLKEAMEIQLPGFNKILNDLQSLIAQAVAAKRAEPQCAAAE